MKIKTVMRIVVLLLAFSVTSVRATVFHKNPIDEGGSGGSCKVCRTTGSSWYCDHPYNNSWGYDTCTTELKWSATEGQTSSCSTSISMCYYVEVVP